MKKIFSTVLSTLLIASSFAQSKSDKVDVMWGPEMKESKKSRLTGVLGSDDRGVYVLRKEKDDYFIEHLNKSLNKTKSTELELKMGKNDLTFRYISYINDEMYVFSEYFDKKTDRNTLYVQDVNKENLTISSNFRKVSEFRHDGKAKKLVEDFVYSSSRDKSRVLIHSTIPADKGENEKFYISVLDNEMKEVWSKKIISPLKSELFSTQGIKIDEEGNVHILGVLYKDKEDRKRNSVNYSYQILSYYDKGTRLVQHPIKIEGKYLVDMQITIDDDKNIICGGFYSNVGVSSIEGSYYLKLNTSTEQIETKSFKEFGIDFITQNMTERKEKKAKKKKAKGKDVEMYQYDLSDIILKEGGGAILIGEQFYIQKVSHTYSNGNGGTTTTTTYYYNYNDIIVINVNPNGEIEWTEKIAKRQVTTNDGGFYSSYALGIVDDKLHFIFNDNPKNLIYNGSGKLYNMTLGKESMVTMVTMDSRGYQEREALFSKSETEIITRPKVCDQIAEREMIVFGRKKKINRFAKLTFQ